MHGGKRSAGIIRADGDQAEIKRPAVLANLLELGTSWQRLVFRAVVVDAGWQMRDCAVSSVAAEPDVLVAGLDAPRAPQRRVLVEGRAGGSVLTGETRDLGGDGLLLAVDGGCDG